ncbi:uncharacterized protein LOC110721193 isoform X2 [Chenopodium quinoa]|uniref:uncharacterized protein LOC110721193 isoform X2 n=1 Tax=Chenopodium quinoa TaxID=63459 RepID=UPI000B799F66|nr:uncharacterized protein LOC110721193 isoform X2 [Chenopodium quinoa]
MSSQNDEEWTEQNDILLDMHDVILDNLARVEEEEEQGRSHLKKNKGKEGASVSKPRAKRLKVTRKLPPNEPVTLAATTTFSNAPVVDTPNLYTTSSHSNSLLLHKIPKSTAARRGLLNTSHQIEAQVITEKEHGESSMQFSADNEGPGGVRNEIHDVLEREHGSDEVHDVLEREHGSDEGDGWFGEINDNYDPYLSDKWESELVDDDNYFSKMYKNGEFADATEFGSIVLKPWMIFNDKSHFIFVLRDYYIQCGFALVVDRSSPTRFTAQCLELNCNWRIHSSVLPYGTTWAVKSIQNSEHTCRGLD